MCGLVGVTTGQLSAREIKVFNTLMTLSNLRGGLGAGVIAVSEDGTVHPMRTQGNGVSLINSKIYDDAVTAHGKDKIHTLIGHTRMPTKGGVAIEAVHPHAFSKVVGVHNGTLYKVDGQYITAGESDSKAFFRTLNKKPIQEVIDGVDGAYCLVWVDRDEQVLNFLRNGQRPLHFASVASGSTLFWASEKSFLDFALARENYTREQTSYADLEPHLHLRFDLKVKGGQIEPISKDEVKPTVTFSAGSYAGVSGMAYGRGHQGDTTRIWPESNGGFRGPGLRPHGVSTIDGLKSRSSQMQDRANDCRINHKPIWLNLGMSGKEEGPHGQPSQSKKNSTGNWEVVYADGAIAIFDHYPFYVYSDYWERKRDLDLQVATMERENADAEAKKGTNAPFGVASTTHSAPSGTTNVNVLSFPAMNSALIPLEQVPSFVQESLKTEAERAVMQEELDRVFGPLSTPPDEDITSQSELPWEEEDLPEALEKLKTKRLSKAELRRIRARSRETEKAMIKIAKANEDKEVFKRHSPDTYLETIKDKFWNPDTIKRFLKSGCNYCMDRDIKYEDATWVNATEFYCEGCIKDDAAREWIHLEPLKHNGH